MTDGKLINSIIFDGWFFVDWEHYQHAEIIL